jgi:hypothetical protein
MPDSVALPRRAVTETQGEPVSASVQTSQILGEAPSASSAVVDDILGIEPETAEEAIVEEHSFTRSEAATVTQTRFEPAAEEVAEQSIHEPVLVRSAGLDNELKKETIEELEPVSPLSMAAHIETMPPAAPNAPMTQQDIQDLAAQIREATARISAVVAQAAAWLHTKEEEILRRTEMPLEPEKPVETRSQAAQVDAAPVISLPTPNQVSNSELPALQREVAWHGEREHSPTVAAQPLTPAPRKSHLSLVSKPAALASWRRIDWAQQFAPKRVAILGAALMAILLILGISLARRPAADVLPQQTRAIDQGGVTLTTHPQSAVVTKAQPASQAASARPAPRPQARRTSSYNDGPDVVTHYYGKPKPSPIRQTAASGVHHYSDMP